MEPLIRISPQLLFFTLSPNKDHRPLTLDGNTLRKEKQPTNLGVTYDKRLTWNQHITGAEAKARRKLHIMRKLAGTQWGVVQQY